MKSALPIRWSEELGVASQAALPVARPTLAMGHGHDLDVTSPPKSIDQAEGKPGKDVPPSATAIAGPSLGRLGHCFNCVPQLLAKTMPRY